jgi:predicted protein tyrosine phosphatase
MRTLVAAGADRNFRMEDGTNLLLAAAQTNPAALAYALSLAKDVNVTDNAGRTPLHALMDRSYELPNAQVMEMFALLAKRGARMISQIRAARHR